MPAWVEYLLRILLAIALGFVMGVERRLRLKVAGIRTHVIVAAGACLFMLVSKYGFADSKQFDASRIASQIVTGISFIGAGMIIYRKQTVHGLTTAAGVWFTAGVGCAAGAGMYIVSAGATVLIILVQCLLHIRCKFFHNKRYSQIKLVFADAEGAGAKIKELFGVEEFGDFNAKRKEDGVQFTAVIKTDKLFDEEFIANILHDYPYIISAERVYDEI